MWTELYPRSTDELEEAMDPVVLTGLPGSARAELVREALAAKRTVELDALEAAAPGNLRQDAVRAVVDSIAGQEPRRDVHRALAEAFGARSADALALVQGNVGIQLPLADIFAALPSHAALIVHDAHLLTDEAWAGRALWALRARMQRPDPPGLVLLSRPWHTEPLVGLDGPFFGFARLIGLPIPSADDWAMATDYTIKPEALNWLLRQTRGVPRTTLAVLEQLPPSDREERTQAELEAAWLAHARDAGEAAAAVRGLVRGLHRFAPRLLRAIAAGEPVYPSVPGARPDAIAKALGRMRDHDVIYQPGPRRWLVADPALVPHLASGRAR